MPRDRWMKLSDTDKQLWDKLPDKAKAIILSLPMDPSSSAVRRVNQHEINDDSPGEQGDTFFDAVDTPTETPTVEEPTTLLINAAKTGHLPPGDIRRILSDG